jgi:RNA polymerase sigma factor (TIGR02999 family)
MLGPREPCRRAHPDSWPRPSTPSAALQNQLETLIQRADAADGAAVDELFSLLYGELHRLAEHALRRDGGALTVGPTTLLHEAYLNMAGRQNVAFADRSRFLAYASRAMRGLVIDFARRRQASKRGRLLEITLSGDEAPSTEASRSAEELVQIGDVLGELAALEPSLAEVVDLHFFCGFSFAEIAALRRVSERTVQRDWRKARLLLQHALLPQNPARTAE